MAMAESNRVKIPTDSPQLGRGGVGCIEGRADIPVELPQPGEAATEEKLAPNLEEIAERLQADAPDM
jgi:hypothetical protein